jgi:hypothetical protein
MIYCYTYLMLYHVTLRLGKILEFLHSCLNLEHSDPQRESSPVQTKWWENSLSITFGGMSLPMNKLHVLR